MVLLSSLLQYSTPTTTKECSRPEPPSPDWITQDGTELFRNNHEIKLLGYNSFELIWDYHGGVHSNTHEYVDTILDTIVATHGNSIRILGGPSLGCPTCFEPSAGVFNEAALEQLDYAIAGINKRGLTGIITLIDNWDNYHYYGSIGTMVGWAQGKNKQDFFTDDQMIALQIETNRRFLEHINPYTGRSYTQEPRLILQLGNELNQEHPRISILDWKRKIVEGIREVDPYHLIIDGQSINPYTGMLPDLESIGDCDPSILSVHAYGPSIAMLRSLLQTAAVYKKAVVVDEVGPDGQYSPNFLTFLFPPDSMSNYLAFIYSNQQTAGVLIWRLSKKDFQHGDGYGVTFNTTPADVFLQFFFQMQHSD